jgi:(S)-citramalyl-CoA lyase
MISPPGLASARSLLFVPGDRPERFPKALASGADAVILDLENAVAPEAKLTARAAIKTFLDTNPTGSILVRVNAADAPEYEADLALCSHPATAAVVLPKASTAAAVERAAAQTGKPIWCIVETARGVSAIQDLAHAKGTARLLLGIIDLELDLDLIHGSPGANLMLDQARFAMVLASRAAKLPAPIDGPIADFKNTDILARAARHARQSGFGGMLCIHPSQTAAVNAAFTPTADELAWAARILAAAVNQAGAFQFEGEMVDAPILARAHRLLERASKTA